MEEKEKVEPKAIQDYYPDSFAWCYGCGRLNEKGLHFRTVWDGEGTLTRFLPRPEHIAVPGFTYGGLIASLIDCHSTGSASLALYRARGHEPGDEAPVPRFVTASLKVDFLKPTPLGVLLEVRGEMKSLGERKVVVESKLYADGILTVTGEVVAVLMPENFGSSSS
ncbi:PaaI family thioesterase [Thermicanus aegyptius]|uniref:PaaI family thioesterase n=1 Tax=Thermicanus aegyptius TaxID=94009 RepID=UPI0012EC1141|nr:PaaI family thioesterase [Thermicanus aegyptius]